MKANDPGDVAAVTLEEKVRFLIREGPDGSAEPIETHMSWVFLSPGRVFKLKKPVRFPYLDFSSLDRRAAACQAELKLNRRLAPDVYLRVAPLVRSLEGRLSVGGEGEVVDWLVVMRRLDAAASLRARLANHVSDRELDRLARTLARFYRRAPHVRTTAARSLVEWRRALAADRRILLDPQFDLPRGKIRRIDAVLCRFLRTRRVTLERRVRARRILDGHGDLRPEHIWLTDPVRIIDGLEFSAALRAADPIDEIAFLDLECERLGAPEAGRRLARRVAAGLGDRTSEALKAFYRCRRAMLRARLSIAHLLDPETRTPEKWPRATRIYLALAARDARRLDRLLRRPGDR